MNSTNWTLILAAGIPIVILQFILAITALISLLKKNPPKEMKIIWALVILLLTYIGPILYFAIGSQMLDNTNENEGDYS